jgi:hypothetical protein
MTTYRFIYEGQEFDDRSDSPFPSETVLEARHDFDGDQTWHPILWQFCRFLEHVGFEGVRKKVKIDGDINECLFQRYFDEPRYTEEDIQKYYDALNEDAE